MARAGLIQPAIRPRTQQPQDKAPTQAPVGKQAKRTAKSRKGKKKGKAENELAEALGIGIGRVDGYEEEAEGERKRRRSTTMLSNDDMVMFDADEVESDPMAAVAPEYRPQVAARMASARSMCSGTTMPKRRVAKKKPAEDE